jgi:hypothetical protein
MTQNNGRSKCYWLALLHSNVTPTHMVHPSESKSVTQVNLDKLLCRPCLPRQGYCVYKFIIEYSSLRDFGPKAIGLFLYEDFGKMIFWLVLKLEINYRVIIFWRVWVSFRGFLKIIFMPGEIFEIPLFVFCLKILFYANGNATVWHTPCYCLSFHDYLLLVVLISCEVLVKFFFWVIGQPLLFALKPK